MTDPSSPVTASSSSSSVGDGARAKVSEALAAAGLHPDPAEIDRLVQGWPRLAAGVESLYTLDGVRYEEPALIFDPTPRFESWG